MFWIADIPKGLRAIDMVILDKVFSKSNKFTCLSVCFFFWSSYILQYIIVGWIFGWLQMKHNNCGVCTLKYAVRLASLNNTCCREFIYFRWGSCFSHCNERPMANRRVSKSFPRNRKQFVVSKSCESTSFSDTLLQYNMCYNVIHLAFQWCSHDSRVIVK